MMARHRLSLPALALLLIAALMPACSKQPAYAPPPYAGSDAAVDMAHLEDGKPLFFTHYHGGKKISFFLVRTGDSVNAYLDACNACYPYKRGYRFENGTMVCVHCGEKYRLEQLSVGTGNCYPIRIPGRVLEGKYLIALRTLEKNAGRF